MGEEGRADFPRETQDVPHLCGARKYLQVSRPAGLLPLPHILPFLGMSFLSFPLVWSIVVLLLRSLKERIFLWLVHDRVPWKPLLLEPRFPPRYDLADLVGHMLLGDDHDLALRLVLRLSSAEVWIPPHASGYMHSDPLEEALLQTLPTN